MSPAAPTATTNPNTPSISRRARCGVDHGSAVDQRRTREQQRSHEADDDGGPAAEVLVPADRHREGNRGQDEVGDGDGAEREHDQEFLRAAALAEAAVHEIADQQGDEGVRRLEGDMQGRCAVGEAHEGQPEDGDGGGDSEERDPDRQNCRSSSRAASPRGRHVLRLGGAGYRSACEPQGTPLFGGALLPHRPGASARVGLAVLEDVPGRPAGQRSGSPWPGAGLHRRRDERPGAMPAAADSRGISRVGWQRPGGPRRRGPRGRAGHDDDELGGTGARQPVVRAQRARQQRRHLGQRARRRPAVVAP